MTAERFEFSRAEDYERRMAKVCIQYIDESISNEMLYSRQRLKVEEAHRALEFSLTGRALTEVQKIYRQTMKIITKVFEGKKMEIADKYLDRMKNIRALTAEKSLWLEDSQDSDDGLYKEWPAPDYCELTI